MFRSFTILPRQMPFTSQQCCLVSFPAGTSGKESTCQWSRHRDTGSVPELGRPPGGGKGHLLQGSCLVNSMDREELRTSEHTGTYSAPRRLPAPWHSVSTKTPEDRSLPQSHSQSREDLVSSSLCKTRETAK